MSEKWTKGPWILERHDHHSYTLDVVNGEECAIGEIYVDWDGEEEGTANAHLAAAAPDLYAALELLYGKLLMADRDGEVWITDEDGEMALNALKKARGEE